MSVLAECALVFVCFFLAQAVGTFAGYLLVFAYWRTLGKAKR